MEVIRFKTNPCLIGRDYVLRDLLGIFRRSVARQDPPEYAFSNTTRPEKCFGTQGIASKCVVRLLYNAGKGHQKFMLRQR